MEDISELYKETILEASRNPHGRKDSFPRKEQMATANLSMQPALILPAGMKWKWKWKWRMEL